MPIFTRVFLAVPLMLAIVIQDSAATEFEISAFGTLNELTVRAEDERTRASNVLFVGAGVAALTSLGLHIEGELKTASALSVGSALALGGGVIARHFETSTERALVPDAKAHCR